MFREMRRGNQQLTEAETTDILRRNTAGVLAVAGDDGYPYAVPLSYVFQNGRLFFHCATSGHKLDAIARNARASFCVVDQDRVVPEEYTTYYRSVIVFGRVRILHDPEEKRRTIALLADRYAPMAEPERTQKEIDEAFDRLCMVELTAEHITGKKAIELVRMEHRRATEAPGRTD